MKKTIYCCSIFYFVSIHCFSKPQENIEIDDAEIITTENNAILLKICFREKFTGTLNGKIRFFTKDDFPLGRTDVPIYFDDSDQSKCIYRDVIKYLLPSNTKTNIFQERTKESVREGNIYSII